MINAITDILHKDEYRIILKDNDLNKAIYQRKKIGYEPQLRYTEGKASEFIMSLSHLIDEKKKKKYKEITYIITTQHLNIDDIDEDIAVDTKINTPEQVRRCLSFIRSCFQKRHSTQT